MFSLQKHFLYFLKRKLLLCFRKWTPALFSLSSRNKASLPIENVLYFSKRKYRKKLLIFLFLYSRKRKRRKNYLYFRKRKFCQLFKKIFKPLSNLWQTIQFYSQPCKYLVFKTSIIIAIITLSNRSIQNLFNIDK